MVVQLEAQGERPVGKRRSRIAHYALEGLLPPGHIIALDSQRNTGKLAAMLVLLASGNPYPELVRSVFLTYSEEMILRPLLLNYPEFCPNEVLHASHSSGEITEDTVASSRERIQVPGEWDNEMKPLRNLLSRVRLKLHGMGLDIRNIFELGYLLVRWPTPLSPQLRVLKVMDQEVVGHQEKPPRSRGK